MSPKISVVMTVYNGSHYIKKTIESVLRQTYEDFEFIIIDDGSSDNTSEVIKTFKDPRIRFFSHENMGISKSKNKAIELSLAAYIAIIDHDDIWFEDKLELQYQFLESNPDYVLVAGQIQIIDKDGNYMYTVKKPETDELNRKLILKKNYWAHSAVMYRKDAFYKAGKYYEKVTAYFTDYMLWYQLSKQGKMHQINQNLIQYRISPTAVSAKTENKEFIKIMYRTVMNGQISEADNNRLIELKKQEKESVHFKRSLYELFLGRSYMFHNYQRKKSINHLKKAVELNPNLPIAKIYLLMVQYIPYPILRLIYIIKSPLRASIIVEKEKSPTPQSRK